MNPAWLVGLSKLRLQQGILSPKLVAEGMGSATSDFFFLFFPFLLFFPVY